MGSMNLVILVGNLGRDAELRYTPGGTAVCDFSMATTETWNDKQGERQERTEWHTINLWGKPAESLSEYLVKGKQVAVRGRLQTDEYTDKEGIKRKKTKIRADQVALLGGGGDRGERGERPRGRQRAEAEPEQASPDPLAEPLNDDDIPF